MPIKDKNLFKLIEKIISLLQTNHHTEYEEYQKMLELVVNSSPKPAKVSTITHSAKYHLIIIIKI